MAWAVEVAERHPAGGDRVAAVDLGVRVSVSLSIEGEPQALHFEGREALKDWDHLGREIAREQQAIAGTRGKADDERSPSSRAISRLHQKRRLRVEHVLVCIAKEVAQACARAGVAKVYLGWPKGILRDVRYGTSKWAGRIHGFWSFARLLGLLEGALRKAGIEAVRVGERGSSSACPCCGSADVVRGPRWLLRCKGCGARVHSDQAGSFNIMGQNKPSVRWAGVEATPRTETLRWDRHCWEPRSANPGRLVGDGVPEFLRAA